MNRIFTAVIIFGLLAVLPGCGGEYHNSDLELAYVLTARPGQPLKVRITATGLEKRAPVFRLFSARGAASDQGAHIRGWSARDSRGNPIGHTTRVENGFAVWELKRNPSGPVIIDYEILNYDPNSAPEATFINDRIFLACGYASFAAPDELTDYRPANITVTVDTGWPCWVSWPGEETYRPESLRSLWSGVAAGGSFRPASLSSSLASVTVLTDGGMHGAGSLAVANRLLTVLAHAVDWFGQSPKGEALNVLAVYRTAPPSSSSRITGVSEDNVFLCLATPDRYADATALTALAVHECLHFYLGGAITAHAEAGMANVPNMIWFFEGLTEYLTYRFMSDSGVLADAEWDRVRREKREKTTRTQVQGVTLAQAARAFHDVEVYEHVYTRGYLVSEGLDAELNRRCGPLALRDTLRDALARWNYFEDGSLADEQALLDLFDQHCAGSKAWIQHYAMGTADPPKVPPTATR